MNKSQFYQKIACFVGYLFFAGMSAYFTATSLSMNILNGTNVWFIFVPVLIISILAGWCLTNVISELNKSVNASKTSFVLNLLGFLIFWIFSFTTNVHYFFVEKHGYSILSKELANSKQYIIDNTTESNKKIDDQKNTDKRAIDAVVQTNLSTFGNELNHTMEGHKGFGEACINILKSTENSLQRNSDLYGDPNRYIIFDEVRDAGDVGVTQRSRFPELQAKYTGRMREQLQKKIGVIEDYYERQKNQNTDLLQRLDTINWLESEHLPQVLKDGSVTALYMYQKQQTGRVISKMPPSYGEYSKMAKIYPSSRMFDTMTVWKDIFTGKLGDMTMIQWIIISF